MMESVILSESNPRKKCNVHVVVKEHFKCIFLRNSSKNFQIISHARIYEPVGAADMYK
jgi:hypothetical protein